MAYFMDKDDALDAAFICILISATTLLNLYDELCPIGFVRRVYSKKNSWLRCWCTGSHGYTRICG